MSTASFSPNISWRDFSDTCSLNDGEVLLTIGGQAMFRLEKNGGRISFTPLSSGRVRVLNERDVQPYLDIFNASGSTNTSDYGVAMQNASYVLAIIKLWMGQREERSQVEEGAGLVGDVMDADFSAPEADLKMKVHWRRERSRELVMMAKALFRKKNGRLFCEICSFDFEKRYGERDFIEAHHRVPLHELSPGTRTKLSDLVMVCANCHRMLHWGKAGLTVEQLRQRVVSWACP